MVRLAKRMGLQASISDDKTHLNVEIPPNRHGKMMLTMLVTLLIN